MSEEIIKEITEKLHEEQWTRTTLNNFSIGNFSELDNLLDKIDDSETEDEILEICNTHLVDSKNSIIALYLSGMISLGKQLVDDSNIVMLINLFSRNHKWNIVEYLANRILSFGENKYALRTLTECYTNESDEEKLYDVWERLIKVDFEEADIVRKIAESKEEKGDTEAAVEYYKKAMHRYINKKMYTNIRDIWIKLIQYIPEDFDLFFLLERKIAKSMSNERASLLLEDYFPVLKEKEMWDQALEVLKRILSYDAKNLKARKDIVDIYKKKYEGHSQLDEYIRVSNLSQGWRNVHEAISDFEKHISFDKGNFVHHKTWGVGRISKIEGDNIVIDFVRKRGHSMSLKMAVSALTSLQKDHIWVLKAIWSKEKLKKSVKKDIPWALKMIIKSFDNVADMKKIKKELVPFVLTQGEWSSWSTEARQTLKTNSEFGNLPDKADQFVVRDKPISFEEKAFNTFKAEKNFFNRISTLHEFLKLSDPESEYFLELFAYFSNFLKTFSNVNEQVMGSFLLIQKLVKQYPFLNPGYNYKFIELFDEIEDINDLFQKLDDSDLRKEFLIQVKKNVANWPEIYCNLFPYYLTRFIVDELRNNKKTEELQGLISNILERYRDMREALIWIARNIVEEPWFEELGFHSEKFYIAMIHLLDITGRDIENRKEVSNNRKYNRQIHNFLFKEEKLKTHFETADAESVSRLITLLEDVKDLDPTLVINLKNIITDRFPDFKFFTRGVQASETKRKAAPKAILCTLASYNAKQQELKQIIEVEIPKNSAEIGSAIELGDLKENAEYKAGKERQEYLNVSVGKLKAGIGNSKVVNAKDVKGDTIAFGTKVVLTNLNTNEEEEYSILGPWESDPNNKVISYLSPLGHELLEGKVGDSLKFTINEREYEYKVEGITVLNF
ncbi:transcription elongation factor GreA [Spirochaeta cellobiosiphila]|uniref:transcription elongation factor GreA n=1 Tax=Spirochaeta cellobiosiphila TaxID=504483 RepID=UPI000423DC8B|nr:transcription elongation factor GreA [Spirochaeta cellobiosiphila]